MGSGPRGFGQGAGLIPVAGRDVRGEHRRHLRRRSRRLPSSDGVNLSAPPDPAEGAMLADAVALIGTIDVVLGSVDR